LLILCSLDIIVYDKFNTLLINGFLFKILVAAADIPIIYAVVWLFRKQFHLKEKTAHLDI
jgi:hypothetical protein